MSRAFPAVPGECLEPLDAGGDPRGSWFLWKARYLPQEDLFWSCRLIFASFRASWLGKSFRVSAASG